MTEKTGKAGKAGKQGIFSKMVGKAGKVFGFLESEPGIFSRTNKLNVCS